MFQLIQEIINSEVKTDLLSMMSELRNSEKKYLLRNDILFAWGQYCWDKENAHELYHNSPLGRLISYTQEIILENESFCIVVRPKVAYQEIFRISEDLTVEKMTVQNYLDVCDRFVNHYHPNEGNLLEIDLGPFYDYTPKIRDQKNIGNGVKFLNRYLSSKLFQDPNQWLSALFNFLNVHSYNGIKLLINERIKNQQELSDKIKQALELVSNLPAIQPSQKFRFDLQELGFEPGWGNTAGRVKETLEILDELIDSPNDLVLEKFLDRIPMIFRITLISVQGWLSQEGVLGRPDTGGQVVYIIDQARSLEKKLQEDLKLAGLDVIGVHPKVIILTRLIPNSEGTRCNERLEKINGTKNAWILRVPFRDFNSDMTQNWISKFDIWPYLETYAIDSEKELLAEFQGKPDLIIGNYTDGSLVAFLLARRLKVNHCHIAHALEKSKYLFSNLYWQEMEENYHFSLQFTADLIAMNAANFIVSNTYQEIVGTTESVGQYESHKVFTMPDLYHVVNGIELFSPKFNVVSPGVNEDIYFPYTRTQDRLESDRERLEELIFTLEDSSQVFGKLEDPNKRPLLSIGRFDRIKNLTGWTECYAQSQELQEHCNLILLTGKLLVEDANDAEEADEIRKFYSIVEQYQLHNKIRVVGVRFNKRDSGEAYRVIADRNGIFIQPALFEAFGLTVLEAMISGLPTFGTMFGGPQEIIQDKINGFYINPTNYEETVSKLLNFIIRCNHDGNGYWYEISNLGIDRTYSTYTWEINTKRLLTLARVYGFWSYSSQDNREDMLRYLETLFYLIYKPRAKQLLEQHTQHH
ncbi:MAG: sucrose synthase [Trichodesmium sp.]